MPLSHTSLISSFVIFIPAAWPLGYYCALTLRFLIPVFTSILHSRVPIPTRLQMMVAIFSLSSGWTTITAPGRLAPSPTPERSRRGSTVSQAATSSYPVPSSRERRETFSCEFSPKSTLNPGKRLVFVCITCCVMYCRVMSPNSKGAPAPGQPVPEVSMGFSF